MSSFYDYDANTIAFADTLFPTAFEVIPEADWAMQLDANMSLVIAMTNFLADAERAKVYRQERKTSWPSANVQWVNNGGVHMVSPRLAMQTSNYLLTSNRTSDRIVRFFAVMLTVLQARTNLRTTYLGYS